MGFISGLGLSTPIYPLANLLNINPIKKLIYINPISKGALLDFKAL